MEAPELRAQLNFKVEKNLPTVKLSFVCMHTQTSMGSWLSLS